MAKHGFWVDFSQIQLGEKDGKPASWVHALSLGTFSHALYGDIEISPERVTRFVANVKAKVRGIDPSINYDHNNMSDAAGWVTDAEERTNGLWLFVEWTATAATKIKERAYRYFSSEFDDEYVDAKTGTKFQDVIYGGALTNRPFLKDLVPVNLSELTGVPAPAPVKEKKGEGEGMDPKVLRQLLGLAETATDDEVTAKIKSLSEAPPPPPPPAVPPAGQGEEVDVAKLLSELVDTGNNPAVKALGELVQAQQTQLAAQQKQLHERDVDKRLSELASQAKTKGIALPPAVTDQLKGIMMNSPKALADMVFDAYAKTIELGVVELGERGWQRKLTAGSAKDRFEEMVTAFREANKDAGYAEAVEAVAAGNPQLYNEYREESFAFRE